MENQKTNPIVEAFNAGKRIRKKGWAIWHYVEKFNENCQMQFENYSFWKSPEIWEIFPDAFEPETPRFIDSIQQAIELLKENGYEIYQITKTKL